MTETTDFPMSLIPIVKLSKDAVRAILDGAQPPAGGEGGGPPVKINSSEARILVDLYYTMQETRKRLNNQIGAIDRGVDTAASHEILDYALRQAEVLEDNAAAFLGQFAADHPMGPWFAAVHGIGPVLSAGILAHLGARPLPPTVGHWWRFAGLDPTQRWESSDKLKSMWDEQDGDVEMRTRILARIIGRDPETVIRDATTDFGSGEIKDLTKTSALKSLGRIPFNRPLKTLCWKIGDQFVKLGSREDAFYARFYRQRKADEIIRNQSGGRSDLAARTLAAKPNHAQKATYEQGMLPDGRIDLMARRATVKLFLSHLHEVWWRVEHGSAPPRPFSTTIQGHAHYIAPPYMHVFDKPKAA